MPRLVPFFLVMGHGCNLMNEFRPNTRLTGMVPLLVSLLNRLSLETLATSEAVSVLLPARCRPGRVSHLCQPFAHLAMPLATSPTSSRSRGWVVSSSRAQACSGRHAGGANASACMMCHQLVSIRGSSNPGGSHSAAFTAVYFAKSCCRAMLETRCKSTMTCQLTYT